MTPQPGRPMARVRHAVPAGARVGGPVLVARLLELFGPALARELHTRELHARELDTRAPKAAPVADGAQVLPFAPRR